MIHQTPFRAILTLLLLLWWAFPATAAETPPSSPDSEGRVSYRRAEGRRSWQFPRDHGQHPAYLLEWWYYTGNLETSSGRRFGYQVTFFRRGLAPKHRRASAWAARSLYMAHAALSDVGAQTFHSTGRMARDGPGLSGASFSEHRVWLTPWRAEPLADDPHGVRLTARTPRFTLHLTLRAMKPPVLHGENGLDRKGEKAGQASWYYSLPRLETRGVVVTGDVRHRVRGTSWMDHEFGTSQLGEDQVGWDWFALRLNDGEDLMLYRLRLADGGASPASGGSLIGPKGRRRALSLARNGPSSQPGKGVPVQLSVVRWWRSPGSGINYPVAWRVELPGRGLRLEVTPEMDAQELTAGRGIPFSYWEGAVRVEGTRRGSTVRGEGYLELTGYGGKLRDAFR